MECTEAYYKKWISGTDATLATFASSLASTPAPTFFERNLRVWQELWRVTEISDILLVLVDVRFPLIHYPPSLEDYVKTLKPRKKVIIVLTKTDLVPQSLALAWQAWFEEREGPDGASVVMMESYKEIERNALTQGVGARFMPEAPKASRLSLLSALKKAHHELLQPPPAVANFPDRLARWKPKICAEVNWDTVENPSEEAGAPVKEKKERKSRRNKMKDAFLPRLPRPVPGAPVLEEVEEEEVEEEEPEPTHLAAHDHSDNPFLSIGLIGQPNVGKSSLLNALLQRKVVRASRTPGKTKALQTILWNSTLRLVDCPGLVCPSFSGMASQVLSGILPIQNVEVRVLQSRSSQWLTSRYPAGALLCGTAHSARVDLEAQASRSRYVLLPRVPPADLIIDEYILGEEPPWTTDALLSTYAQRNGFLTAKAGRPDIYRAGAFILRQMHNSAIPWAFRPPASGSKPPKEGIFLEGFKSKSTSATSEAARALMEEESEEEEEEEEEESEEESEDEDDDEAEKGVVSALRSAFSMLEVEGGSDEEESEEE